MISRVLGVTLAFIMSLGCGSSTQSEQSLCGSGDARLSIGTGDPMVALADEGIAVEEGLQGGYHIDVSLSVSGVLDPDQADITLALWLDESLLARHRTDNWLLKLYDDPHCEYPEARLVFSKRDGSLLELGEVMALIGQTVRLEAAIETPTGSATGVFNFDLSVLIRQQTE
ncbi:MAG: hypothetical protein VYA30_12580 [Myxococcota bacterium]|nr:hypothetical protein [Myxococcota bacterium]